MTPHARSAAATMAALLLLSGCEVIRNARTVQDEMKPYAAEPGERTDGEAAKRQAVKLDGFALPDFVSFAMTNRPDTAAAELAVSNAAMAYIQTYSDSPFMPHVDVSGGHSASTHNGGSGFSWKNSGKASGAAQLEILLYDAGRWSALEQAAKEDIVSAMQNLADLRSAVFLDVSTSYFTLLQADALYEAALTNETEYATHLQQAKDMFAAGSVKKLDILRAKLDLADARLLTISASNDVAAAAAKFMQALGLETDRAGRDDILPGRDNRLSSYPLEFESTSFTADQALDAARDSAPSLAVLRAKMRAASHEVDYRIADMAPTISFSTAFNFADPAWNWTWGFSALYHAFTGWRRTDAVEIAVIGLRTARENLAEEERRLSYELALAVTVRDTAKESLEAARVSVRQARENLDLVTNQYKLGDVSRIDFTDAVAAYTAALGKRVQAFYEGQRAEATLIRLLGESPVYLGQTATASH